MLWTRKHPQARAETLDLLSISLMLSDNDRRPAREQLNSGYQHGGGWRPFKGFTMLPNGDLQYPGEPPIKLLYEGSLMHETIRLYQYGWVAIVQPLGKFEVCRMG